MKPELLKVGDVVHFARGPVAHVAQEHAACDENCVYLPNDTIVLAVGEAFRPELDYENSDYWEFLCVGPTGLVTVTCHAGEIMFEELS